MFSGVRLSGISLRLSTIGKCKSKPLAGRHYAWTGKGKKGKEFPFFTSIIAVFLEVKSHCI